MIDDLPQGWATAPLARLAEACMGETILAKQLTPTGVPVYSAGQANEPWGFLDEPKKPFKKGTVVISARGSIGFPKVPKAERFAATQTTIALRFPDEQLAEFVCLWLKTVDWTALTRGGSIPMLTVGDINELAVPLAPIAEQRRIVAKLEEVLGKADACQQRLARIPTLLKRFRLSVLAAACSGRLTEDWREQERSSKTSIEFLKRVAEERLRLPNERHQRGRRNFEPLPVNEGDLPEVPDGWSWATIDQLANKVVDGVHRKPDYVERGIPFLTVRNLTAGTGISFDRTSFVTERDHLEFTKRANPEKGDVLVTKDGTLGVARLVDTDRAFSIFVSLALIKPVIRDFGPYLLLAVSAPQIQRRIVVTGSGLQHIHLRDLRAAAIPIPPEAEQREIVRRTRALLMLADNIESRLEMARAHADAITSSVFAKAFRGELVPTEAELARREGRDYEDAELLLERLSLNHTKSLRARASGYHK